MKRINILLMGLFLLIIAPAVVEAVPVNLTVSCPNVVVGNTVNCTISATVSTSRNSSGELIGVTAFDAKLEITGGAQIVSVTPGSGWTSLDPNMTTLGYITQTYNKTGSFTVATVQVKGVSVGAATLKVNNANFASDFSENYAKAVIGNKSAPFTVTQAVTTKPAGTTAAPKTTTRANTPTTAPKTTTRGAGTTRANTTTTRGAGTTRPNNTTTNNVTTSPIPTTAPEVFTTLKLDSVKVDDFEVTYADGKYYATVDYDTESVQVSATANPNITIVGQGTRNLAPGKNVVELILYNEGGESATVQVVITRPGDDNEYNTYLTELKVVGYDIDFNRDINEYTISVPLSVDEIYIIAATNNVDVSIIGDGLQTLGKGKNDFYIRVEYGNKASNEYVIHVKRNYNAIIMSVLTGIGVSGLFGFYIFYTRKNKKMVTESVNEKNRILAEANRTVANSKEAISINGNNVYSPTRTDIAPNQVVEKRVPTNPVTVATSTVNPQTTASSNQVRIVKTGGPTPVKTVTPVAPKVTKQVVIKTNTGN